MTYHNTPIPAGTAVQYDFDISAQNQSLYVLSSPQNELFNWTMSLNLTSVQKEVVAGTSATVSVNVDVQNTTEEPEYIDSSLVTVDIKSSSFWTLLTNFILIMTCFYTIIICVIVFYNFDKDSEFAARRRLEQSFMENKVDSDDSDSASS